MITATIDHKNVKHGFTTHEVPQRTMAGTIPFSSAPQIGDLVLAEVISLGQHRRIELPTGVTSHIFPGDLIVGAFGNRYATDQFEGYVPSDVVAECDLLSIGGVLGQVVSQHPNMDTPTRLRVMGAVCDAQGKPLNLRSFSLPPRHGSARVILVVGSSMNAGKTTTVGTLARALKQGGYRVAAAKITGTAAGKDGRFFTSCGARPVLDFTYAGYPSTYMIGLDELLTIYRTLLGHLSDDNPDYVIVEIADGIFQRETRMLLECEEFRQTVTHLFFAANDSLSADCAVRCLKDYKLPLRALSGAFTQSALAMREAEVATGIRCLNLEQMLEGGVLEVLGLQPRTAPTLKVEAAPVIVPRPEVLVERLPVFTGNGHHAAKMPAHRVTA